MSAYGDWNKIDEEDDEELQDTSVRQNGYAVVGILLSFSWI
jgi:hypothetical protein